MSTFNMDPRDIAARKLAQQVIGVLRDFIPRNALRYAEDELYRCAYQVGARLTTDADGLATAKEINDVLGKGHQATARGAIAAPDPGGHGGYSASATAIKARYYQDLLAHQQRIATLSNAHRAAFQAAIVGRVGAVWSDPIWKDDTPALPQEVKAGEIVGWRAWKVNPDGTYSSMFMDTVWRTDQVIEGDVKGFASGTALGVHAWKTQEQALAYVRKDFQSCSLPIVIGTIDLWGTVVEHQEGYRASFGQMKEVVASVLSADNGWSHYAPAMYRTHAQYRARAIQGQKDARRRYADYKAMEALAVDAAHRNPITQSRIITAADPAEEAYRIGKEIEAMRNKPIAPIVIGFDPAADDTEGFSVRTIKGVGRFLKGL